MLSLRSKNYLWIISVTPSYRELCIVYGHLVCAVWPKVFLYAFFRPYRKPELLAAKLFIRMWNPWLLLAFTLCAFCLVFLSVSRAIADCNEMLRFTGTNTLPCFSTIFTKGNNFVTSRLLSRMTKPFQKRVLLLTYWLPVDSSTVICWMSLFCHFRVIRSVFYFWWKILLANTVDPDQMPHYVASDLGLHCLPMILLRVFRYESVKWKNLLLGKQVLSFENWPPWKKLKMAELRPLNSFILKDMPLCG